jgi:transcriptional regulator with XRE-family HTH domain
MINKGREATMLRVRALRHKKGFTQIELAEKAKIAQAYLSEIETGKTKPSLVVLERIAESLGCKIADLLENEEEEKHTPS